MSAKTGDNVYETIKTFGMEIAKNKMEKQGINWFASSPGDVTRSGSSQPSLSESPPKEKKEPQGASSK